MASGIRSRDYVLNFFCFGNSAKKMSRDDRFFLYTNPIASGASMEAKYTHGSEYRLGVVVRITMRGMELATASAQ